MNKTIAMKTFLAWFLKMKPYLECLQKERIEHEKTISRAEKNFELLHK